MCGKTTEEVKGERKEVTKGESSMVNVKMENRNGYGFADAFGTEVKTKYCCGIGELYGLGDCMGTKKPEELAEFYKAIIGRAFKKWPFAYLISATPNLVKHPRTPTPTQAHVDKALQLIGMEKLASFDNHYNGRPLIIWGLYMDKPTLASWLLLPMPTKSSYGLGGQEEPFDPRFGSLV
jgi:hypothetical protein